MSSPSMDEWGLPNWDAPKLTEEAHFKTLRDDFRDDFKAPNLEWLLYKEALCRAGLSRVPEGESGILYLSSCLISIFPNR